MKSSIVLERQPLAQLGVRERTLTKAIALASELATHGRNLRRALRARLQPAALIVGPLDHVTIPVRDLDVAERFYVGVLGADVIMRCDEAFFAGRGQATALRTSTGKDVSPLHTSLSFGAGPRIDLFLQSWGQPAPEQPHTHFAFSVAPSQMLRWQARLTAQGIPSDGPRRLGPPGQASLYFNDPFGNHLEIQTLGFGLAIPIGPPNMEGLVYQWRDGGER
jgi:catechol 2,3-dioxygenase-like lactoylglutathione lyase family enzyme